MFGTCNKKLFSILSNHYPNLAIYTDLFTLMLDLETGGL